MPFRNIRLIALAAFCLEALSSTPERFRIKLLVTSWEVSAVSRSLYFKFHIDEGKAVAIGATRFYFFSDEISFNSSGSLTHPKSRCISFWFLSNFWWPASVSTTKTKSSTSVLERALDPR